jgi:hypothetical protein
LAEGEAIFIMIIIMIFIMISIMISIMSYKLKSCQDRRQKSKRPTPGAYALLKIHDRSGCSRLAELGKFLSPDYEQKVASLIDRSGPSNGR